MLRSFLARSHPLLSRLRRHDRRLVAQLGRRADGILIQARGYSYTSPSEDETDSDVDRPDQARHTRKHLYMVLDDWNKGFSIHKLDLLDEGEGSDMGGDLTLRPPVHRQATGNRCWNFAAVGSKIVAAGRVMQSNKDDYVTLVYDTGAAGLSIVPRVPEPLHDDGWALATAAAAGNRLYTFEKISFLDGKYNGGMHILEDAPAPVDDDFWWGNTDHWSWIRIPKPPPFRVDNVESVTMHPAEGGGRTLFVSVGEWNSAVLDIDGNILDDDDSRHELNQWEDSQEGRLMRTTETFSYDTKTGEWRRHGHWDLPFHGQAYYDAELDAWVGLRKVYDQPHHHWTTDGYLCSCDVASPDGSPEQPARKLCAEGLFDPYTCPTDVDASLLYMGGIYMGGSNYCLVQVMACESFKTKHYTNHVGRKCVIRVTTFRLKYGKKGELIVTARRPDRSFHFSGFFETPKAHAFWM